MKIGKETIPGLTQRNIAAGLAYYWEPSPRQRKAGWTGQSLGMDLGEAIRAAKAQNEKLATWRQGGARPTHVRRYTAAATFGALLDRYEAEKLVGLSANSQRVDKTQLGYLREWAGDKPVGWISRARVRHLKLAICPQADELPKLLREGQRNIPGHNPAFKLLSKGREVFSWAIDHPETLAAHNPFERFGLPKPPPRDQIWEPDALALFGEAATALGWDSIGFALRLGCNYGQRESDILALTPAKWREVTLQHLRMDRDLHVALASPHGPDAGRVMGFTIIQGKTRRPNGVPIAGAMRDEVEAAIGAAKARAAAAGAAVGIGAMRLIVRDDTGLPWSQREFVDKFAEIRDAAACVAMMEERHELAARLSELEFRDSRRTCVVTMGEIGMDDAAISARTGHSQGTIKAMLEVYMPRTEAMAARGTVAMLDHARRTAPAEKEKQA